MVISWTATMSGIGKCMSKTAYEMLVTEIENLRLDRVANNDLSAVFNLSVID